MNCSTEGVVSSPLSTCCSSKIVWLLGLDLNMRHPKGLSAAPQEDNTKKTGMLQVLQVLPYSAAPREGPETQACRAHIVVITLPVSHSEEVQATPELCCGHP